MLFVLSACQHNKTLCVDPHLATCYDTIGHALYAAVDGDTIQISADVYNENLYIKKNVSLAGSSEGPYPGIRTVVRGALPNAPVIHIMLGKTVHLSTIMITGGNSSYGGGGIDNVGVLYADNVIVDHNSTTGRGGGILNVGTLIMTDSLVQYNTAIEPFPHNYEGGYGGGIYNHQGTVTLTRTDMDYNTSNSRGGGLYTNGDVTITDGNISHNESESSGGGIEIEFWSAEDHANWENIEEPDIPKVHLERVDVDNNHAGWGGGINNNGGTLVLTNVTLSGNEADQGGGAIWAQRTLAHAAEGGNATIYASTIAYNKAPSNQGGGIESPFSDRPFTIAVYSTIFADNLGGNCVLDCSTIFQSWDYNISDDATCNLPYHADLMNTDPKLNPLALNAPGRVRTHALQIGSPADDHSAEGCNTPVDARGVARGLPCDTGAYEGTEEPYKIPRYTAVLTANAYCRTGPGTYYEAKGYLHAGETHTISGRNLDGTWYKLENCWVARSLLTTEVDPESIPVLEIPPPPTPTARPQAPCSEWTSPETCRAAGCTWNYSSAGPGSCK
jgi:predicted outer membrane repeat protein